MDAKQNSKPSLIRKNSVRKAPEIRQTLTSKYRMLKANPLMLLDVDSTDTSKWTQSAKLSFCCSTLPRGPLDGKVSSNNVKVYPATASKVDKRDGKSAHKSRIDAKPDQNHTKNSKSGHNNVGSLLPNCAGPSKERKVDFVKRNIKASALNSKVVKYDAKHLSRNAQPQPKSNLTRKNLLPSTTVSGQAVDVSFKLAKKPETIPPIRRSLSAQYLHAKRSRSSSTFSEKSCSRYSLKAKSSEEINKLRTAAMQLPVVSPIVEEINFKTPSAYERRSIVMKTPLTGRRSQFLPRLSTAAYYNDLQQKLNDWLKKRGKSIGNFTHLKCFGVNAELEENKENIETEVPTAESYEDLKIISEKNENVDAAREVAANGLETIAKGALQDLHVLISEGYPREQCEAWLNLVNQKYPYLEEEPQYWECRAAIEQARGNITSAVECFKAAIVQGAEIKVVDESLDQLLQKFSLLNINTNQEEGLKDRARIIADARNVFKSSIIQFAVRERSLKNKKNGTEEQKKFIATPVRRSTRVSNSLYRSTPGVQIYSSMKEIQSPIRNCLDFKSNTALSHV